MKVNRIGQAISEYAVVIAIVAAVAASMTLLVKRALQANIKDAKDYMMDVVRTESRINIADEYEPYYIESQAQINQNINENVRLEPGGSSGKFTKEIDNRTEVQSTSVQAPPREAD